MTPGLLTSLVLLAAVGVASAWVLGDARARAARGRPVVATVAGLVLERPETWAALCLVGSVFFLPLYLVARAADG